MKSAFFALSVMALVGGAAPAAAAPGMTVDEIMSLISPGEEYSHWARWPKALRRGYKTRVLLWKDPTPPPGKLRFTKTWDLSGPVEIWARSTVWIIDGNIRQTPRFGWLNQRVNGFNMLPLGGNNNFWMIYPDRSLGRTKSPPYWPSERTLGSGRFSYKLPWPEEGYGVQIVRPAASYRTNPSAFGTPLVLRSVVTNAIRFQEPGG